MEKRRGRPQKSITWPNSEFTSYELKKSSEESLSNGLIHMKIKEAIAKGEIELVGKSKKMGRGRPSNIYRRKCLNY